MEGCDNCVASLHFGWLAVPVSVQHDAKGHNQCQYNPHVHGSDLSERNAARLLWRRPIRPQRRFKTKEAKIRDFNNPINQFGFVLLQNFPVFFSVCSLVPLDFSDASLLRNNGLLSCQIWVWEHWFPSRILVEHRSHRLL